MTGDQKYALRVIHRYPNISRSPSVYQPLDFIMEVEGGMAEHQAAWDMLCRYMDVSQPLPDIPQLEPFRDVDPTTRAYDTAGKRGVEKNHWKEFYARDGWQELEEARKKHRATVGEQKWNGREDIMIKFVPNYLSMEQDMRLDIKSDSHL